MNENIFKTCKELSISHKNDKNEIGVVFTKIDDKDYFMDSTIGNTEYVLFPSIDEDCVFYHTHPPDGLPLFSMGDIDIAIDYKVRMAILGNKGKTYVLDFTHLSTKLLKMIEKYRNTEDLEILEELHLLLADCMVEI